MYFKVISGEYKKNNGDSYTVYTVGDIVETDKDLSVCFRNTFVRVPDDSVVEPTENIESDEVSEEPTQKRRGRPPKKNK